MRINNYYDLERSASLVHQSKHRELVGGLWDAVGQLQFDFLRSRGIKPDMRVIDVGCGCLRAGLHLVRHLLPGHYYGVDISQPLLDAGYDVELAKLGLQHKLPRENLLCDAEFRFDRFGVSFDIAIAQSLFSHLPLNHIKLSLARLGDVVREGGVFYATFFLCKEDQDWESPILHSPGSVTTHPASDPYHYRGTDLAWCTDDLPWTFEIVGDWGHPRDQMMAKFTRKSTTA